MKTLMILSNNLLRKTSFHKLSINRNRLLLNKSLITKKCLYSTTTVNTEPIIGPPITSTDDKQYPEKIRKIVTDISNLTLIEVSELNELLKKTLNISDTPMMAFGAMPVAGRQTAQEEDEEDIGAKTVQTSFTIKLNKFDETKKVALIKEIKAIVEGMNLVQAKKFVESVPQIIRSNVSKDEAEKLKTSLEAVGGICEIE